MDSLSPNIFVNDINATIAFYQQLGFKLIVTVPDTGTDLVWAMMTNGGITMMFQTYTSLGNDLPDIKRQDGGSLLLYIKLKNIKAFFEEIKNKVTILHGLQKTFTALPSFL